MNGSMIYADTAIPDPILQLNAGSYPGLYYYYSGYYVQGMHVSTNI